MGGGKRRGLGDRARMDSGTDLGFRGQVACLASGFPDAWDLGRNLAGLAASYIFRGPQALSGACP